MATIHSIAETQKSLSTDLMARMADFENQLKGKVSPGDVSLPCLSEEFKCFKLHVQDILCLLQQQVEEIMKNLEISETRYRNKFLLLMGVPEKPSEDVLNSVTSIFSDKLKINCEISNPIKSCSRLGKASDDKCRPILIKFSDQNIKTTVWSKKASLKGSSYVLSEFLTKNRQTLFLSARKHIGMRNVWTHNGSILVKLPAGNLKRIHTQKELDAILPEFPVTGLEPAKSPSNVPKPASKSEVGRTKRLISKKK